MKAQKYKKAFAVIVIAVCCVQILLLLIQIACFFLAAYSSWGGGIENFMAVITKIAGYISITSAALCILKLVLKIEKAPLWLMLTSIVALPVMFLLLFIVYAGRHF